MEDAVIVDAVRTPMGKRNGRLSGWHPADLAAEVLKALGEWVAEMHQQRLAQEQKLSDKKQ